MRSLIIFNEFVLVNKIEQYRDYYQELKIKRILWRTALAVFNQGICLGKYIG